MACVIISPAFVPSSWKTISKSVEFPGVRSRVVSHSRSPHTTAARFCSEITPGRAGHTESLRVGSCNEPDDISLTSGNEPGLKNEVSLTGHGSISRVYVNPLDSNA